MLGNVSAKKWNSVQAKEFSHVLCLFKSCVSIKSIIQGHDIANHVLQNKTCHLWICTSTIIHHLSRMRNLVILNIWVRSSGHIVQTYTYCITPDRKWISKELCIHALPRSSLTHLWAVVLHNITLGKQFSKHSPQYCPYTLMGARSSGAKHDPNHQTFEQSHQLPVSASPQ